MIHSREADAPQAIHYEDGLQVMPQAESDLRYTDTFSYQVNPDTSLPEAIWRYQQHDSELPQALHTDISNLPELPGVTMDTHETEASHTDEGNTQSWPRRNWKALAVTAILLAAAAIAGPVAGTRKQNPKEDKATTITETDHSTPSKTTSSNVKSLTSSSPTTLITSKTKSKTSTTTENNDCYENPIRCITA
jgi:hypothetical protein